MNKYTYIYIIYISLSLSLPVPISPAEWLPSKPIKGQFLGSCCTKSFWKVQNVQNVQNTSVSEQVWKLRCRKSACRCGTKHISKAKV